MHTTFRSVCSVPCILCALGVLSALYLVCTRRAQCKHVTSAFQRRQRMYNSSPKPTNAEESHSVTIRHIHRAHHRDQSSAPKFQVRCSLATVRGTSTATKHHVYLRRLRHGRRSRTTGQRWKSWRSGGQSRTVYEMLIPSAPPPPSSLSLPPISELT